MSFGLAILVSRLKKKKSLFPKKQKSAVKSYMSSKLTDLYNRQLVQKAKSIPSVSTCPHHSELQILPPGSQFRFPSVKSNGYRHSFIPTTISLLTVKGSLPLLFYSVGGAVVMEFDCILLCQRNWTPLVFA